MMNTTTLLSSLKTLVSNLKTGAMAAGLSLSLTACYFDDGAIGPCIRGRGEVITEQRIERPFTGIEHESSAHIFVKEGSEQKVVIEGYENVVPYIETKVVNNTLVIDSDRCFRSSGDITIYVTVPELKKATVRGSGKIVGETDFVTSSLVLSLPGSGTIELEAVANDVSSSISGSGRIYLSGTTNTHDVRISGSGEVLAFDLPAVSSAVQISGSGRCELTVSEELDVRISGSGSVRYKGDPHVTSAITGSGRVIPVQ